MDFNLKQWRDHHQSEEQQQEQEEEVQETTVLLRSAKLPRNNLLSAHPQYPPAPAPAAALPLFVPDQSNTDLPPYSDSDHCTTPSFAATKSPTMGSYFSLSQWQELQLQALIFRHMIAGAAVPPELLHLVKKSIIDSPYNYLSQYPLHQYYPHYQPALLQSGYWGRAAMDPEPGRCRRTDGKKWRCSRDVVEGQKYCERHMHRGRNRSRKPVEIPTSSTASPYGGGGQATIKTNHSIMRQPVAAGGGGGGPHFTLSHPTDLLHLDQRPCDSIIETKGHFESQNDGQRAAASTRTLRHFFDDWPKPLHETDSTNANANAATNLSISMPGNPSSDFSLKLGTSTGAGDEPSTNQRDNIKPQLINWSSTWEANLVAPPMGGPLAEALRSSMSASSPTSVLHRLPTREVSSQVLH